VAATRVPAVGSRTAPVPRRSRVRDASHFSREVPRAAPADRPSGAHSEKSPAGPSVAREPRTLPGRRAVMRVKRQAIGTPDRHRKGTPHRRSDRLVPVANRRVPRASRSALTSDGAARVGGAVTNVVERGLKVSSGPGPARIGTSRWLPQSTLPRF
jgi:hypothetical protein